jgi:hypothetical protein
MTKIKGIIHSPYLLLGIIILALIAAVPPTVARHRAEQANRTAEPAPLPCPKPCVLLPGRE